MIFWDASAVLPLLHEEPGTAAALAYKKRHPSIVVWWLTELECRSAIERIFGEGKITTLLKAELVQRLGLLLSEAAEIQPSNAVRARAARIIATHRLKAADALQLAAALIACRETPAGHSFVCFDKKLGLAAANEGLALLANY